MEAAVLVALRIVNDQRKFVDLLLVDSQQLVQRYAHDFLIEQWMLCLCGMHCNYSAAGLIPSQEVLSSE